MATDHDPATAGGATAVGHDTSATGGPDQHGAHAITGHDTGHDAAAHGAHAIGGHDAHDSHEPHPPAEDPRWVLIPLVVGLVIAVVILAVLGLDSGARPFT